MVAPIAVQLGIHLRIVDSILLCSALPLSFFCSGINKSTHSKPRLIETFPLFVIVVAGRRDLEIFETD